MAEKVPTEADLQAMLESAELSHKKTGEALAAVRASMGVARLPGAGQLEAGNTACDSGCDGSCTPLASALASRVLPAERTGGG